MGSRGPLPKAETRRRNKRPAPAGTVVVERPTKPKDLTGEAAKEWNRIVPELMRAGYLTKLERGALIRYCRAWEEWLEVADKLKRDGSIIPGYRGQLIRNPLWLVRNDLEKTLSDLGSKLGLVPGPRLRMDVEHVAADAKAAENDDSAREAYMERLKRARDAEQ